MKNLFSKRITKIKEDTHANWNCGCFLTCSGGCFGSCAHKCFDVCTSNCGNDCGAICKSGMY